MNDDDHKAWKIAKPGPRKEHLMRKMLVENEPLARKFLRRIVKFSSVICDEDDLMQAARVGLWAAITKYDTSRPTRFSTMAFHWVRYHVSVELTKQPPIRRPRGSGQTYQQVRAADRFRTLFGREATAEDLGVTQTEFDKWSMTSWHFAPVGELEHAADQSPSVVENLIEAELDRRLAGALEKLAPYQRQAVLGEKVAGLTIAQTEDLKQRVLEHLREELDDT